MIYINGIESFISKKFSEFNKANKLSPDTEGYLSTQFDLMEFIKNPDYQKDAINKYEQAKDKFNILDIIISVPHFQQMLKAMATDNEVLGTFAGKYNLTKKLALQTLRSRAIPNLTPKDMGEINRFISDITIVKFLKTRMDNKIVLTPGHKMYNSLGVLVPVPSSGKIIDFANVFDRATFKIWFEQEFIPTQKLNNPNNKFINSLTSTYYKNSFGMHNYLYKLPIDLGSIEQESNQIAYSNYLKAFDEVKYNRPLPSSDLTMGDLFFLYNLLVSKNSFGDNTLTKLFETSLNIKDKNQEIEVEKSLLLKFVQFEASLNPNLNGGVSGLIEGEDCKFDDLLITLIERLSKKNIEGDKYSLYPICLC